MRKINKLIVHCSATPQFKKFDVEDITEWHVTGNGWSDCGYHYVITLDGTIQLGRPVGRIGSHCKGVNRGSIGICYIGGMDSFMKKWIDTRTPEQKEALEKLLKELKQEYPEAIIYGHNDFTDKKVCPCFNAKEEYKHISNGD
jgi:N-acetylmuramoyl-L-alanine amidase|tara:strand:+ start:1765 stop:2193 length:429 start_codon:yes stop_codon:yes gene_type:complete